ncbi:hypothetical protein ACWPKO_06980 [Coraliomargarita sp. W4R53]
MSEDHWNYILVFSDPVGTKDEVKKVVDEMDEVTTWYLCMSNAIFIRSNYDSASLSNRFREYTKDKGRFMIIDLDTDRNGWLPKKAWEFIKE